MAIRAAINPTSPKPVERLFGKRRRQAIISFGTPADPNDETSDVLAGDLTATPVHNGTLDDIDGSWVELEFNDTLGGVDAPRVCAHNLFTEEASGWPDEPEADEPNVRWFIGMWEHSGAVATRTKTTWDDMRVSGSAGKQGAANPPTFAVGGAAPFTTTALWWFANAGAGNENQLYFQTQLSHGYKEGTNLLPHIHWTPEVSAGAANQCVRWRLDYSWANIGALFAAPTVIYTDATDDSTQTEQAVQLVASDHYLSLFEVDAAGAPAVMDGTGMLVSSMLTCRLQRDSADAGSAFGADDYPNDAGLLEIDFHYEIDGPGSDVVYPKTADVELGWTPFSLVREAGDAMDANNIELRLKASPFLSVTDANPLKVTLFFIKAVK